MAARMSKVFKSKPKEVADLSGGFDRRQLVSGHVLAKYGIAGNVIAAACDQVQSLLAVASTKGLYVLGQHGVEATYKIAAGRQIAHLQIHKAHLIAIDTQNMLYSWLLEDQTTETVVTQALRGVVTTTFVEQSVDWLFLGMKDGTVQAWDIEGEQINTTFKVKNQYFDRQEDWRLMGEFYSVPRYHISPVLMISLHPTDLGMMLITYADGACLYSLKDAQTKTFYECIIPEDQGAPSRKPALTCATFSPDGEFVLICCNDGTFAFFGVRDGEVPLQIRNIQQSDINHSGKQGSPASSPVLDPISDVMWCCRVNPLDSFVIIAGGLPNDVNGLSILDYGTCPNRIEEHSEFFASPQRQRILPTSRDQILSLLPLGCASPFHIAHDPRCVLLISAAGVLSVLDMPDGQPTAVYKQPPSLSICSPHLTGFAVSNLPHYMLSQFKSQLGSCGREASILVGGARRVTSSKQDSREGVVLCTVHEGTLLRIFDLSRCRLESPPIAELDASLTLPNSIVTKIAVSKNTGELALASESGLVVIYQYCAPASDGGDIDDAFLDLSLVDPMPSTVAAASNMLFAFSTPSSALATLSPRCVVSARKGQVSALTVSDVGFVGVAYDSGSFLLIDLRGPAIFFVGECSLLEMKKKDGMFKKTTNNTPTAHRDEHATAISFVTMTVDGRLSLVALVGTTRGRCISLELLKAPNGVYSALLQSIYTVSSCTAIKCILGCNQFGESIMANGSHLSTINMDADIPDCVLLVAADEVVCLSGLSHRLASVTFRGSGAVSAEICTLAGTETLVLAVSQRSDTVEVFAIPSLHAFGSCTLSASPTNLPPTITDHGDVLLADDHGSMTLTNILGQGSSLSEQREIELFDTMKQPSIPRPTISTWAWVTGTQYVKPADLDLIISGGNRPLSKRALERLAASEKQQALLQRQAASRDKMANRATSQANRNIGGNDRATGQNAFGDMQQGGNERGELVSHVNDVFDNISKASGEWLGEIDKITSNAKKSAGKAVLRNYLGF